MNPSRRMFLQQSAAIGLSSIFPFRPAFAETTRPIGVQLYTVQDELKKDPAATLKALAGIGYREVESFPLQSVSPVQLRKMLDDAGLKCPSAHLFFGLSETSQLLEQANVLGAHYAVSSILHYAQLQAADLPKMLGMLNAFTLDDFKKVAAKANEIGAQAKKAGLQYAYHNHNFEFRDFGGHTGYETLLAETDPELVKFELDCGWMTTSGHNPIEYFTKYPGRYPLMHAKDFPADTPVNTTLGVDPKHPPTEIGRGHIDYKSIIAAAERSGVQHIFVEQDPPIAGMTSLEAVRISYQTLRPLV
ncbi:sugar phosphate isomerase/epimerase [Granulicella sp. S190]|uniref:sugar phosphate isomerase/epimerase family protein n=1 Tax=Granulicella sp. S190 TaxID=1747226 RepID=UPI00131CD89F|nr:sugar phosphate isomerase/epimerase [Granulicella sp. S190]